MRSAKQCSHSSDQWTQFSQPASRSRQSPNAIQQSTDSQSFLPSQESSLPTQPSPQSSLWFWLSSSVFFTTVFAILWSAITSFLEFFFAVQECCRFTSSGNRVVSPPVLPSSSHNLHNSPQMILSHCMSFVRNPECRMLPILLRHRYLAGFPLLWNPRPPTLSYP